MQSPEPLCHEGPLNRSGSSRCPLCCLCSSCSSSKAGLGLILGPEPREASTTVAGEPPYHSPRLPGLLPCKPRGGRRVVPLDAEQVVVLLVLTPRWSPAPTAFDEQSTRRERAVPGTVLLLAL